MIEHFPYCDNLPFNKEYFGPQEYYMLKDDIWKQITKDSPAHMLCIGCVEYRLGRKLTKEDFAQVPINSLDYQFIIRTERLKNRLDIGFIEAEL